MDEHALNECRRAVAAHTAKVVEIRGNRHLSEHGRREALRESYNKATYTVRQLRADDEAKREAKRSDLARSLFGLPHSATAADVVAFRDAADRVAKITDPAELGELMQQAADSGDRQLLRAAAAAAFHRSDGIGGRANHFHELADLYAEETASGSTLDEYRSVLSRASVQAAFIETMGTTPPMPAELRDHRPVSTEVPRVTNSNGFPVPAPAT